MWMLRYLTIFVAFLALAILLGAIRRRRASRTLRSWGGVGVHRDLSPAQASLLLGGHPTTVVLLWLHPLMAGGRVELISSNPPRFRFAAGEPRDRLETIFSEALDEKGAFGEEGVYALLEEIYREVDREMAPHSGSQTAEFYHDMVKEFWESLDQEEAKVPEAPELAFHPWLLILDGNEVWDFMGDGEGWEALKSSFRLKEQLRSKLISIETLRKWLGEAKTGYFAWRRDLMPLWRYQPYFTNR